MVVGRTRRWEVSDCAHLPYPVDGCEELEDGLWYWGEEEPEEDPGGVFVLRSKGPLTVLVAYYGPAITGDPRQQELPIDVSQLLDLASDRRIDATTSRAAVKAGAQASYWRG